MIDTQTKRLTAVNVGLPWRGIGPEPDGTIDDADLMGYARMYAMEAAEIGVVEFMTVKSIAIRIPKAVVSYRIP